MTRPETTIVRSRDNGPLHDLLLKACPPNKRGEKSIKVLALKLDISTVSIHKWIRKKRIPARRAKQVATISEGRVSLEKLTPFVFA